MCWLLFLEIAVKFGVCIAHGPLLIMVLFCLGVSAVSQKCVCFLSALHNLPKHLLRPASTVFQSQGHYP